MGDIGLFVLGTSSGGHSALRAIASRLPSDFPAAVCVVMHMGRMSKSELAPLVDAAGPLTARFASDGERLSGGLILIAPPDYHLIVTAGGVIRLGAGPKENFFRPAIDPLFRSAARIYGRHCAGIVLTGGLDDGSAGLVTVERCGGVAIVQDALDVVAPSMPLHARRAVPSCHCLKLDDIGDFMSDLATSPVESMCPMAPHEQHEIEIAVGAAATGASSILGIGEPTPYTCPECHGTLMRVDTGAPVRFRCHTGHAFTRTSLSAAQHTSTEAAIWAALRAVQEERETLLEMARDEEARGEVAVGVDLHAEVKRLDQRARRLRDLIASAP